MQIFNAQAETVKGVIKKKHPELRFIMGFIAVWQLKILDITGDISDQDS